MALLASLGAIGAGAAARTPPVRQGETFARVHARLTAAGYRPYRVLAPGSDLYRRNLFGRDDVSRLYPEVAACAGTGLADCDFVLARGPSDIVIVHTVGEDARRLAVQDVRHATQAQADAEYR